VIWNVGAIAASGHPRALELVRDILIASAAIPAAFPPAMIDVEVDGKTYQEMHVDGGTTTQVFLYPPSMKIKELAEAAGVNRERRVYVVRNARLEPEWKETPRRTLSIAGRAVSSLIATQGIGDLYRTYLNAQRDGIDYNLVSIPLDFKLKAREAFDREYMQKLFDVGFELGKKGGFWRKTPPAFEGEAPG
jgi:predicted acylesterase/phospholipase RssA